VLARVWAYPKRLAQAFDVSPEKIQAKFHRVAHQRHLASEFFVPVRTGLHASADGWGEFCKNRVRARDARIAWTSQERSPFPVPWACYYTAPFRNILASAKFGDVIKVMGSPPMAELPTG